MLVKGSLTGVPLQRVLELELQPELQPESELRPERVAVQVLQVMKSELWLVQSSLLGRVLVVELEEALSRLLVLGLPPSWHRRKPHRPQYRPGM